ncbi:bifunctional histidinol-phosphatase/imidazoleglycerol-phosphate dehydratase HisB [Altibacter sp. HG106]|uniref:bifunctional histidinol-phosphatase/imidazoleglycerol-phosphate dehydratase HisB n=1 Tax=Altibacter sp. HG106 TaxID=3023937 RepID=UPI00234FFFDE|nr:bifunctional histidinol-phosphatase/imidazoleglycerol-phosphate dehydratase HisB [Altibacter sp. HG106]MDC7993591.1 bifunctional histidinol-phosphatase/imidazoleglycerol-phosphate dehydratase HisB [Altibacter sp. HG106]
MKRKVLFIDRDGTLVREPEDEQLDSLEKLEFYPRALYNLSKIAANGAYELVMVTNQDGLGTEAFPEDTFWPTHNFIVSTFENEGVIFDNIVIDRTFAEDQQPTRKPGTALLQHYFSDAYDLEHSFVIGDRLTDVALAKNLGARAIFIDDHPDMGAEEVPSETDLEATIALRTSNWDDIYTLLMSSDRIATITRNTKETKISATLNLDGTGQSAISTGIAFFDHMLDQLARHGTMDLKLEVQGDLEVDEHHTIEDTALALGAAFKQALGNKQGLSRYGFCLPMDDCLAQVAIDFGGRNWLVWEAEFNREMIGKMPTEMFMHFFKSFSDAAQCNLNIKAEGTNEHHKIEAIFKAFARAVKGAIARDLSSKQLPTTKGVL